MATDRGTEAQDVAANPRSRNAAGHVIELACPDNLAGGLPRPAVDGGTLPAPTSIWPDGGSSVPRSSVVAIRRR
ncbi:hypothetical protein TEK04_02780 [Klenkia sp. LSe6-5]|uniref:Uncharacterized protein n=1 Tax=Klenkia sesuvii TaxID=3103137 RepID=A0ABU8DPM4_9ACTN